MGRESEKTFTQGIKRSVQAVVRIIYPLKCVMCGKIIEAKHVGCCAACRRKLPYIREPACYQCGKPLDNEEQEYCLDCQKKQHAYVQAVALWSYNEQVKHAVYRFKYKNNRCYSSYFAREIVRLHGRKILSWQADVLMPVPLHRARYRKRGFNQAWLLARDIAACLGIPADASSLRRIKNTKPQKELNDKERQKNLKSAFIIDENSVKLKKIILVDDIYTTGATVDAITEVLLQAGAAQVFVVTLCIGKGY